MKLPLLYTSTLCFAALLVNATGVGSWLQDANLQPSQAVNGASLGLATATQDCQVVVRNFGFASDVEEAVYIASAMSGSTPPAGPAQPMALQLAHDVSTDSWTLTAALPECAQPLGSLQVVVWCERCALDGRALRNTLIASTAPPSAPAPQRAGTVVLKLRKPHHVSRRLAQSNDATAGGASAANDASPSLDATSTSTGFDIPTMAHMWFMAIGWGVLIPSGIVISHAFKTSGNGKWWFQAHRALQTLGFVMGVIGLALGFVALGGWETDDIGVIHRNLGMAATALGLLQITALAARPSQKSNYRLAWSFCHAWMGRSAAVIAIYNIYYGILYVGVLGMWAWASYTAVLAVIVAVALGKDAYDYQQHVKAARDVRVHAKPTEMQKAAGAVHGTTDDLLALETGEEATVYSHSAAAQPPMAVRPSSDFARARKSVEASRARLSSDNVRF